jgi:hypothetical protein
MMEAEHSATQRNVLEDITIQLFFYYLLVSESVSKIVY